MYGQLPVTDQISDATTTKASISIDGASQVDLTLPPIKPGGQQANDLLFNETVNSAKHNLVVNVPKGFLFTLDYILVKPLSSDNAVPTSSNSTPPMTTSHETPVGAIAGGIVGGMIGLIGLFLLFLWAFRRRNTLKDKYVTYMHSNSEAGALDMTAIVTPCACLALMYILALTIR